MVELQDFKIQEPIDHKHSRALATVVVNGKGYWVKGIYQSDINEFFPDVLGDPYELEDHYEEIKRLIKER
jgi:hypothetical protein